MLEEAGVDNQATQPASTPTYRVDVPLYTLLQKTSAGRSTLPQRSEPAILPDPVYPQITRTKDLKRSGFIYHANNGVRAFRR